MKKCSAWTKTELKWNDPDIDFINCIPTKECQLHKDNELKLPKQYNLIILWVANNIYLYLSQHILMIPKKQLSASMYSSWWWLNGSVSRMATIECEHNMCE